MSGKHIKRYTLDTLPRGGTDWARVEALTDEEITEAMRTDPDWADDMDIDWSKARVVSPPKKTALSIRLDEDVVRFFKDQGRGYQSRINAVLRHYVTEKTKSGR